MAPHRAQAGEFKPPNQCNHPDSSTPFSSWSVRVAGVLPGVETNLDRPLSTGDVRRYENDDDQRALSRRDGASAAPARKPVRHAADSRGINELALLIAPGYAVVHGTQSQPNATSLFLGEIPLHFYSDAWFMAGPSPSSRANQNRFHLLLNFARQPDTDLHPSAGR